MRLFGNLPPVGVFLHCTVILCPSCRIGKVLNVIADGENHLVGDKSLVHQVQHKQVRHFPDNQLRLLRLVGTVQYLTGADAVGAGTVCLDCLNGRRLPAPRMVDEQFRVLAEQLIKQVLIPLRAKGNIAHCEHPILLKFLRNTSTHAPEIRERLVRPKLTPELHFIQFGYSDAVLVGWDVLRYNVHCHFAEKEVRPDPSGCRDAGCLKHVEDNLHGEIMCRELVGIQVVRHVHEHLVDGVDHDVLRGNIFEINLIDAGAILHVVRHPRRRDDEVNRQIRVCLQLRVEV